MDRPVLPEAPELADQETEQNTQQSAPEVPVFPNEGRLPSSDSVLLKCSLEHYPKSVPNNVALTIRGGDGLSVEWDKYSDPETTIKRNLKAGKVPSDYRAAKAKVGDILAAPDLIEGGNLFTAVNHDPVQHDEPCGPNQAHSLIVPKTFIPIVKKGVATGDHKFDDASLLALKRLFKPTA